MSAQPVTDRGQAFDAIERLALVLEGVRRAQALGWRSISTARLSRLAAGDRGALPREPRRLPGLDRGA